MKARLLKVKGVLVSSAALAVGSFPMYAHATGTLTVPTIDLTDFYTAAGVLMGAMTAMWIAYKVIGFFKGK